MDRRKRDVPWWMLILYIIRAIAWMLWVIVFGYVFMCFWFVVFLLILVPLSCICKDDRFPEWGEWVRLKLFGTCSQDEIDLLKKGNPFKRPKV